MLMIGFYDRLFLGLKKQFIRYLHLKFVKTSKVVYNVSVESLTKNL